MITAYLASGPTSDRSGPSQPVGLPDPEVLLSKVRHDKSLVGDLQNFRPGNVSCILVLEQREQDFWILCRSTQEFLGSLRHPKQLILCRVSFVADEVENYPRQLFLVFNVLRKMV